MSELDEALDRLGDAHGAGALETAFHRLLGIIRRSRRKSAQILGPLAETITQALHHRDLQRTAGATPLELAANFEKTIRACWPFTREWKFLCNACDDYGLQMQECAGDTTCGRTHPHGPHSFGAACWCEKGRRFREKAKTEASAIDAAARVKKAQPSRFGRN